MCGLKQQRVLEIEQNYVSPQPALEPIDKRAPGKSHVWALVVKRTGKKEVTEAVPPRGLAAHV